MAVVKIDGSEYEYEKLSDIAKSQLNKINYTKKQYEKLRAQIDILKTAEKAYYEILKKDIDQNS